uniref:Uncharacterized protein n=1 Tax=Panagrolaimus sp. JU765 TaxID=591449 RepID=A0AC34QNT7_9BILA
MKIFVLILVLVVLAADPVLGLRGALFRSGRSVPVAEMAPQGFLRFERSIMAGRERRGDSDEEESGRFG